MLTRDWTATVFIVQDGRTLLLHHRKLGLWLPPGGHIDPHELPHLAAIREAREETGLEIELLSNPERPIGGALLLPQPLCVLLEDIAPDHQHIDLIYAGRVAGGQLSHAVAEHHAARWAAWDDLDDPALVGNVREIGRLALQTAARYAESEAAHA
jgi:8-oxo-dGTP pyrophosphatase MutT (NUDIX family)